MSLFYKYIEDMGIKDQKFKNCLKKKASTSSFEKKK